LAGLGQPDTLFSSGDIVDSAFWQAKWRANEIGFHQTDIHPLLSAHWLSVQARPARVLVPLCGKSRDLCWLRERGHTVVGFELSEIAVTAFYTELGLVPSVQRAGDFVCYETAGIAIYCGDFFNTSGALCGYFDAVYDRAALIALAPAQREVYVATIQRLCRPAAHGLLITVEYPEGLVSAPPFSIGEPEVRSRYGQWCDVAVNERRDTDVKGHPAIEVAYGLVVRGS
jgi:thiopurine S-methyltransferase